MKAVSTSLNTAFLNIVPRAFSLACPQAREKVLGTRLGLSANISVTLQATLNLYAYFISHCLAVLCNFLGDFWEFWERDIFSQSIG